MATPQDRRYAKTHEWVKIEGTTAVVGITEHAQEALGDITFVELPAVGKRLSREKEFGVIESVKAASDLYAPVAGEVAAVNSSLATQPELVNKDPYGAGWLIKVTVDAGEDGGSLMDAAAYDTFSESE